MHIAFWAASDDGSSWYRCTMPAQALTWQGHRVWASEILPTSQETFADVIVGSRVANPTPLRRWKAMAARDNGPLLVMDFDDDYWHLQPENKQPYDFWDREKLSALAEATGLADRVTCVSEPLAHVLRDFHDDVRVVPNGLHAMWLGAPRTYNTPRVRVGWAGTASTITELHLAARALNRIIDYTASGTVEVDVVYIGATPAGLQQAGIRPHPRVKVVEWIPGTDTYLQAVAGFDIWVAPYRSSRFTEAKFPTKALEASFLGIPLVASPIGPYRDWITHGVDGYLATEPHEWGRWLKALVDDPGLRARIGRAARARASQNVTQGLALTWESALTR